MTTFASQAKETETATDRSDHARVLLRRLGFALLLLTTPLMIAVLSDHIKVWVSDVDWDLRQLLFQLIDDSSAFLFVPPAIFGLWLAGRQGIFANRLGWVRVTIYLAAILYGIACVDHGFNYLWSWLVLGIDVSGLLWWSWRNIVSALEFAWFFLPMFIFSKSIIAERTETVQRRPIMVSTLFLWMTLGCIICIDWTNENQIDGRKWYWIILLFFEHIFPTFIVSLCFFAIVLATRIRLRWMSLMLPATILFSGTMVTLSTAFIDSIDNGWSYNLPKIFSIFVQSAYAQIAFCFLWLLAFNNGLVCVRNSPKSNQ